MMRGFTYGRVLAPALALVVGIAAGVEAQRDHLPHRLVTEISQSLIRRARGALERLSDREVAPWQELRTNKHDLEVAALTISHVGAPGGALAELGDNMLIASPKGHLTWLDAKFHLHALDAPVPMNLERLRRDPVYRNVLFDITQVRTNDLLAVRTGANRADVYATFDRFAGNCFDFVVARLPTEVQGAEIRALGPWQDVWKATPCVPLKSRGTLFMGMAAGGRIVQRDDHTLLVSIGDFQFDGFFGEQAVSMDPRNQLGKVVALDLLTGSARPFAIGLRNPQGLMISRDGRIWETEHGPQGGDEVNLLVEGANYGWPIVTYGMAYGSPPTNWPANPRVGGHDGYVRPRFAFVPSIAISNLVEPDPREFPNWVGSLVVASLRGNSLFVLRTEGDDIVYAEPIALAPHRLRDIISLHDGRLAVLTDDGTLLLIRNATLHRGESREIITTGLASLPSPAPDEAPPPDTGDIAERQRLTFSSACSSCHSIAGEIGAGPPLNGVIGRRIGSVPGFGYSEALRHKGGSWTRDTLTAFLSNPAVDSPGTQMPSPGLNQDQIEDVISFLDSLR